MPDPVIAAQALLEWDAELTHCSEVPWETGRACPQQGSFCSQTARSHRPCVLQTPTERGSRTHRLADSGLDSHHRVWINAGESVRNPENLAAGNTCEVPYVYFLCVRR